MTAPVVITGSYSVSVHICDGCRNVMIPPCELYSGGKHRWECFDHWGHPTGEQSCECGALRHHPDDQHAYGHDAGHRAYLEDGGTCWCADTSRHTTPEATSDA